MDCEVAVDVAFAGTVLTQTSATHEGPAAGTYPELQTAFSPDTETLPTLQSAVATTLPFAVDLLTPTEFPLARAGTAYPEEVVVTHAGAPPATNPSTRDPVREGLARSRTSPETVPESVEGKSPVTETLFELGIATTWP